MKFFEEGMDFVRGLKRYRVIKGTYKDKAGDLILQRQILVPPGKWYIPMIEDNLIEICFKYQLEENNYPRSHGFLGGEKLMRAINRCIVEGWEHIADEIARERMARRGR